MNITEQQLEKLRQSLAGLFRPLDIIEPLRWIEDNINLANDRTSAEDGTIHLDAWQRAPVLDQFDPKIRMVVIIAPEQGGKSTLWRLPLVYKMLYHPAPRWVIYESDDKAEDINRRSVEPLLKSIPEISEQLNRISSTKRCYVLANGSITDFSGAGADITSKPCRDGVADELDRWGNYESATQQLRNFRKRFRTYARKNQGCLVIACTPKTEGGSRSAVFTVFDEMTDSSYWFLRCKSCNKLTLRSCDIHNLQWEMEENNIITDSLTLICPACGFQHVENDATWMTDNGGYLSKNPGIVNARGYQVGTLGIPRVFAWLDIANAQLRGGASSSLREQEDFDNSWRALPWRKRKESHSNIVKKQIQYPDDLAQKIKYILIGADTQDASVYYVVRAFDGRDNSYLLDFGQCGTWQELTAVWDKNYYGKNINAGIIDVGGHRPKEVYNFLAGKRGFYAYKGDTRIGRRWKFSTENPKLVLCNEPIFKGELLYGMYNAAGEKNSWFLPQELNEEYLKQITDMKPDRVKKRGNDYANWTSNGYDHAFDCEKEIILLREIIADKVDVRGNRGDGKISGNQNRRVCNIPMEE